MENFSKRFCMILFLLCFQLCSLTSCKKTKSEISVTELDKLPPISQTGANTFGCLINGKAFLPNGGGVNTVPLKCLYDPNYGGGDLSIRAKNFINANDFISITLNLRPFTSPGTFSLSFGGPFGVSYFNTIASCNFTTYDPPSPTIVYGTLLITSFSNLNRIISGTFSYKVNTSSCGFVEVTYGRFDLKF